MIETILFATDFSKAGTSAELYARHLARELAAGVLILHAVEPIADGDADPNLEPFMADLEARASEEAALVAARFEAAGVACEVRVVREVRWRAIVAGADAAGAGLIVMGTHQLKPGDAIGTTSHKVFFATRTPLMVVPPA